MTDTSNAADRIAQEALRRRDPVDRMRDALAHSDTMRALALEGLRSRFPDLDSRELVARLIGEPLASELRRWQDR